MSARVVLGCHGEGSLCLHATCGVLGEIRTVLHGDKIVHVSTNPTMRGSCSFRSRVPACLYKALPSLHFAVVELHASCLSLVTNT
jgi:hypothetical protein